MKNKTKVVLGSVATIALSVSLAVGGTFALFTDQDNVSVVVTAGNLDISATVSELETYSFDQPDVNQNGKWTLGGEATKNGNEIVLSGITPGDKVVFTIGVKNESSIDAKYQVLVEGTGDSGLLSELLISVDFQDAWNAYDIADYAGGNVATSWIALSKDTKEVSTATVTVELPTTAGEDPNNDIQGKEATLSYTIVAVQGNANP